MHALVDTFVAQGHSLRAFHERYLAIRQAAISEDKRHKEFLQIVQAEVDLLEQAQRVQQEFRRVLDANRNVLL